MLNKIHYSWLLWIILLIVCSIIILNGNTRSVSTTYNTASQNWIQEKELYSESRESGRGYLYLPQAAILYIPFAVLPFKISELCWRLFSIGFLIYALWSMATLREENHRAYLFLAATIMTISLGVSCFRNGQMNLMVTSLGLLSVLSVIKQQWNRAALWLVLGITFKPLMIVLVLLLGALHKSIRLRLLVGFVIMGILPFLIKNSSYVMSQYVSFFDMLMAAKQLGIDQVAEWAQFFGFLTSAFNLSVPSNIQLAIRLMAALATLGLCYIATQKQDKITSALTVLALSVCYLLLFNPRTEPNSYVMLAPSLAYFAYYAPRSIIVLVLMLTFAHTVWLQVLPAIIFTGLVTYWIFHTPGSIQLHHKPRFIC